MSDGGRTFELTSTEHIVLGFLALLGEASPYDLKRAVAASIGNFWSLPHSQLYRAADRLHELGLAALDTQHTTGGRPRKLYSPTAAGRAEFDRWLADLEGMPLPDLRDPGLLKLFFGADPRALAAARLPGHREQLAGYEERSSELAAAVERGAPAGPARTLESGIGHEREWIGFWERLARR